MSPRCRNSFVLMLWLLVAGSLRAVDLSASGISVPFFDAAGKLTHKLVAKDVTRTGSVQNLRAVEIHYFSPTDSKVIIQKLQADEAIWDDKKETLTGDGSIVVATEENRLTGKGFDFALATSLLHIHRNFTMTNNEVVATSDRATVELLIEKAGEDLKVRDVKRCEAMGNLQIAIQPTAKKKYMFEKAFSDRAVYEGSTQIVTLPNPTRTRQRDGGEGQIDRMTINLKDSAR